MYGKVGSETVRELQSIVGKEYLLTEKEAMLDYAGDEFPLQDIRVLPEAVIRPAGTDEISEIMRLCSRSGIAVTPRGGGTGLCGGCVPACGGVVMTFERLARKPEIDVRNLMAGADAGVTLADFYKVVEENGLFFPPHPGDEGATIGGIIATNAGGARAVKYGVVRNFIHGLEVVLANGDVLTLGGKIIKNSSGYSLMHLMIGSEGTLGIVTRAYINLIAPPRVMNTLIVPYARLNDAIDTVPELIRNKILPMAVEFVERGLIEVAEAFLDKKWPCQEGEANLMIIIDGSSEEETLKTAEAIGEICLEKNALDVFIADTRQKQQDILHIRSEIYETQRNQMLELLDITVPRAEVGNFVADVHEIEKELDTWLPCYGHAADGNVHTSVMKARWKNGSWEEIEGWSEKYSRIRERIHRLGKKYGGVVSGEHGIGLVKKNFLADFLGPGQIDLMKGIKNVFDPKGILNPGKIF
jgi:glycolate oxidase